MTPVAARARILVADDEAHLRDVLAKVLREDGHTVFAAAGGVEACEIAEREQVQLVLADLTMPDRSGLDVLSDLAERAPGIRVIIMTAYASAETAVEAMKRGALDYLIKPFALEEVKLQMRRAAAELALARENAALKREAARRGAGDEIVGDDPALRAAVDLAARAAAGDATVLIQGESGTGKELIARAVHAGARRAGPFLAINCAAVPDALLERELFGHERGAFTGADGAAPGLLEAASDGTLFLDEIGEMAAGLQAKLLRVLEGHEFLRLGGTRPVRARTRFVAATNKDLAAEVGAKRFRQDLFYRLNVIAVTLPPLRARGGDVLTLADHFVLRLARERGRTVPSFTEAARAAMRAYGWPGNVRELQNVLERAVLLSGGDQLDAADLALTAGPAAAAAGSPAALASLGYREARELFEREYLQAVLAAASGNVTQAAGRIGLDRRNLQIKLKRYGLRGGAD